MDDDMTATCSVCQKEGQEFSKRQLKLAAERKPVRCKVCIEKDDRVVPAGKATSTADASLQAALEQKETVSKQEEEEQKSSQSNGEEKDDASDTKERVYFSDGASADGGEDALQDTPQEKKASSSPKQEDQSDGGVKENDDSASDTNEMVYFSDGAPAEASEEEEEPETSLNAIKQQVLGRLVRTSSTAAAHDREDAMLTEAESINLRKELSCAICHDLLYQPVSLHCGHSFCQECFSWWMTHSSASSPQTEDPKASCPTCRTTFSCSNSKLQVNTALRACILALFANELKSRMEQEQDRIQKATRGEDGGAHAQGYAIMCRESKEVNTHESGLVEMTRSIVLDAEDQRMQLALTVRDGLSRLKLSSDNKLSVDLCVLTMEEDEVADANGFPWKLLDDGEDDENEALIDRHAHSFIEAKARVQQSIYVPIARHGIRDGEVSFLIDVESSLAGADALLFRDEETGAELEFTIPARWFERGAAAAADTSTSGTRDRHTNRSRIPKSPGDDAEMESEGEDEFEEDGFVVMEGDEEEDAEEEEEDPCCICRKGGELMVCDGGVNEIEGCGRNFHIECVGLDEVPPGDWVCETCSNENGMDVGMEGHEFPASQEEEPPEDSDDDADGPTTSRKQGRKRVLEDSDDDDEDVNNEDDASNVKPGNEGAKKRKVIIDSDDDDDE